MCDGWQDEQDFFLIGNLNSGPHVPNVCPKVEPKFPSVFNLFLESGQSLEKKCDKFCLLMARQLHLMVVVGIRWVSSFAPIEF